jgi:hypothetical protein
MPAKDVQKNPPSFNTIITLPPWKSLMHRHARSGGNGPVQWRKIKPGSTHAGALPGLKLMTALRN